jgi:GAF domain-containing protein
MDETASVRELTELILSTDSFDQYAEHVVELAAERVLPGASCALTLRRGGRILTAASSNDLAARVDEVQYGAQQGPCLESMETGVVIVVVDLADEDRWGEYRLHAIAQGVRASLSLPITASSVIAGALNLYSATPGAFSQEHVERATHFADQAAGALQLAIRLAEQASMASHLQAAMSSRSVIDQAIGIVMAQNRCNADDAFGVLRQASQNRNVKLRRVAEDIVTAVGGTPPRPAQLIQFR